MIDSNMVSEIIETLRYYALPELDEGKIFYIFPSEFTITFMLGQKENPNIPKITTCVLRNVSVNYSPNGIWGTLPNGAPLVMTMSLDFRELELIDRKRVYDKNNAITSGF